MTPYHKLTQDNSCHWYVIPEDREDEWNLWLDIPEDDERSWDVPEFAKQVDGPHRVRFAIWEEER